MVDADRLKHSWAQVAAYGDQVPLRFYSRLFVGHPEIREMFPLSMAAQRDKLVAALGYTVSHVEDLEALTPFLRQLGRDHRKFGVRTEHYQPVGEALLATLEDFLDVEWSADLAQSWADAYSLVARVMIEAAEEAAVQAPAWWEAEVVSHQQRTFDIAVLTLQIEPAYDYVPGQSMALETVLRPRVWRYYSPANAPREDGTVELHVRRVPGGQVSSALVDSVRPGDRLRVGAPVGQRLALPPQGGRDLLLIAGGTGLAPLKALTEQVASAAARREPHRRVALFVGAATERELYDLEALQKLAYRQPWLTVVAALTDDVVPHPHETGHAVEVALRQVASQSLELSRPAGLADLDIAVCGSDQMVAASVDELRRAGCPIEQIYFEGFHGLGGEAYGVTELGENH